MICVVIKQEISSWQKTTTGAAERTLHCGQSFFMIECLHQEFAQKLWNIIIQTFGSGWGNVEEVMPGSWDMQMISGMKADPKCREFVSEKDVMEELGCILREMSLFQRI